MRFDNLRADVHDVRVKSATRAAVLFVATVLMAWQAVVVTAPHYHADSTVPQEELVCSASRPSSQTNHLHASGHAMSPHYCLACLAGSPVAEAPESAAISAATDGTPRGVAAPEILRSRLHIHCPLVRGPPLAC